MAHLPSIEEYKENKQKKEIKRNKEQSQKINSYNLTCILVVVKCIA